MAPETSVDPRKTKPRPDKAKEASEAAAKTPDKTNDWDRDLVHGDGDTIGISPDENDLPN